MTRAPGPGLRAVLFDMDGTLTDSEKLWTIALQRVAASYGGTISARARTAMVGQDMWVSIDLLHQDLRVRKDPSTTAALLVAETERVFRAGLPWRPGAQALLRRVRAGGLATALVTATHRQLVDIAVTKTLGAHNFDVTVAGDEVADNKPHPAPYLRALDLLGLPAQLCVAIEDSPTGSASAAAAGLAVLVVPSETPVDPAPGLYLAASLAEIDVADLERFRRDHLAAADRDPATLPVR